ncbi:tryptophan synthase alpha chain [Shewanella sp. NFH-SH190041]|uniref:tryptophan synthase subunit alpha n=1 Tax=Shewanella sp. NFH-SH190041 TaxID=2950245 RepID=UPI0021C49367|nr:tryptophan synthase subunit alpha [Shewanella sp. NFH-SH190041]BDM65123.1 tryptophan synthase alpha chain [Shewanella sp. NFH-SH190041]
MSRYQTMFTRLQQSGRGAFVPFVTLGDPTAELSLRIIDTLIANGADALELGLPFSDPLADGPVIQEANLRALNAGITPTRCFNLLNQIRAKHPQVPIGLLVYANLVYANGIDDFYAKAQAAGVDSVLIADVPVEESSPFREAALAHQIAPIFIAPPNAQSPLLARISRAGQGYTYLLSRAGVTGSDCQANMPVEQVLTALQQFNAPPPLLGFGISTPEQVKAAIAAGAAGAISGSAVVGIIGQHLTKPDMMLTTLGQFTAQMKAAT